MLPLHRFSALVSLPAVALSALLAAAPALQAAESETQAEQATEQDTPYFKLRRSAAEDARAGRWDEAIAQARQLLAMALPRGNPYDHLDASELLYTMLYLRGQYAQALKQTDEMMALSSAKDYDPISGQMLSLVQRGLMAARMADDKAGLDRYLQSLNQVAKPYAPLWQWDAAQNQLNYRAAQLSLPLTQGRWTLYSLETAKDRKDDTALEYIYLLPNGKRMLARILLRYEDRYKDMDAKARRERLLAEQDIRSSDQTPEPGIKLPELPFTDAVQVQQLSREARQSGPEKRPDILHLDWNLIRGNWHLIVRAEVLDGDRDLALQQLPLLWQSFQWLKAIELPPQLPNQEREVTKAWQVDKDWPKAGQLARAALPDAQFPAELARLNTVAGIAAFKAGQQAEAGRYLDRALQAWPYVGLHRLEAEMVDQAQQYGAEVAAQQGKNADAAWLMRQYLRNAGGLQNIWVQAKDPQVAELENRRTGMVLPMRAAGFHLQEPLDSQRMMYRDLMTEQQLGLTTGLKIPESDEAQEKLLRTALEKQFRLKVGMLKKRSFTAQTRAKDRKPVGRQWTFEVSEQENTAQSKPGAAPVNRVVFWIVDQGASRSILRASVSTPRDETRSEQLAQALSW